MIKTVHTDFPVVVMDNIDFITPEEKILISQIAEEKRKNFDYDSLTTPASATALAVDEALFSDLFDRIVQAICSITPIHVNHNIVDLYPKYVFVSLSYTSTEHGVSIWHDATGERMYHNHKHTPQFNGEYANLTAIYYMEMPQNTKGGHLDLKQEYMLTPDGKKIDRSRDWRYHKRSFFPDTFYQDKHTIIQEVVSYLPEQDDILLMPQDLDHRVAPTQEKRLAIVFQMPIKEDAHTVIEILKNKSKEKE